MRSQQFEHEPESPAVGEARYDTATLQKVTALAQQLQSRHQKTLTAREMEEIGTEVGLDPAFIRQALALIEAEEVAKSGAAPPVPVPEAPVPSPREEHRRLRQERNPARRGPAASTAEGTGGILGAIERLHALPKKTRGAIAGAWWGAGWTLPFIGVGLGSILHFGHDAGMAALFFGGWAIYIGGGILISHETDEEEIASIRQATAPPAQGPVSREAMLDTLFHLQRQLEGQKQHRAFLSVDVVDSTTMKRAASELVVEYCFRQYHRWVEEIVRANGGELQSSAGDGVMCCFPTNEQALQAARMIQQGLPRFNTEHGRLGVPFRVRCGVSAGLVALEEGGAIGLLQSPVIDRAAALQKRAQPGGILVSGEAFAAAQAVLGNLSLLPDPQGHEPVFSWNVAALPGFDLPGLPPGS